MQKTVQKFFLLAIAAVLLASVTGLIHATSVSAQSSTTSYDVLIAQAAPTEPTAPVDDPSTPQDESVVAAQIEPPAPTCESSFPGLGWLLCQLTRAIYGVFDYLVNEVLEERLLKIDIDDAESELQLVWSGFRTLANLVFIIIFFVIIYAEASGRVGILETYSLNRVFPRLFIAVIGIQLSFYIVVYLIGLFNDLGEGVADLVLAPLGGFSQFDFSTGGGGSDGTWFGLPVTPGGELFIDNLVALPAIAAVGIAAVLFLPTIFLGASFGLALMLLTLIARKIIIISLIVVGPIAFAAFVLPSTERMFRLWWDTLIKALVMYPLIMLFIASGQILGRISLLGEDVTFMDSMIGIAATFLPLFMIPFTFRFAGAAVAGVANTIRSANDKLKGDIRDPRSLRSWARDRRGRNWNRMLEGNYRIGGSRHGFTPIPRTVRRGIKRMPFVDAQAPLVADMAEGEQWAKGFGSTGSDDLLRMIAITGGGRYKGVPVKTAEGTTTYSGWLQHGKAIWRGADPYNQGRIQDFTDGDGFSYSAKFNPDTGLFERGGRISKDDFYSSELISQGRSMNMSRGRLTAAAMYTMGKSKDEYTQAQVWHGMKSSRWAPDELKDYVNGVWYATKNSDLHNKFLDYGYFEEKPGRTEDVPIAMMNNTQEKAAKSFKKMIDYVDKSVQSYPLSQQSGAFWRSASIGLNSSPIGTFADPNSLERKQLDGIYKKVNEALAMRRTAVVEPGEGDDGEFIGQSQATAEAIREMDTFKRLYEYKLNNNEL